MLLTWLPSTGLRHMFWDSDDDEDEDKDNSQHIATEFLPALKHSEKVFPSCFDF